MPVFQYFYILSFYEIPLNETVIMTRRLRKVNALTPSHGRTMSFLPLQHLQPVTTSFCFFANDNNNYCYPGKFVEIRTHRFCPHCLVQSMSNLVQSM